MLLSQRLGIIIFLWHFTAKFDDKMRSFLLQQQLDKFLDQRVRDLLAGNSVDPIEYNSPS